MKQHGKAAAALAFVGCLTLAQYAHAASSILPGGDDLDETAVTGYVTSATAIATAVALLVLGVAGFYFMKGFLTRKR